MNSTEDKGITMPPATDNPIWPDPLTVYQMNFAGYFAGSTHAFASPMEPDVWHIPAGCVTQRPPEAWPDTQWPRWNGATWALVPRPQVIEKTPEQKLAEFLATHPDVQAMLG